MSQHDFFNNKLDEQEIEFVRVYIRSGFDGEKAARFTYGLTVSGAYSKSKSLLSNPKIQSAIAAAQQSAMDNLKIDATWVLREAVEIYNRCMHTEKVIDKNGVPTGELKFDANNALKALKLIGDMGNVSAFDQRTQKDERGDIVERLNRGRKRMLNS